MGIGVRDANTALAGLERLPAGKQERGVRLNRSAVRLNRAAPCGGTAQPHTFVLEKISTAQPHTGGAPLPRDRPWARPTNAV
jgi:hypothetical protein